MEELPRQTNPSNDETTNVQLEEPLPVPVPEEEVEYERLPLRFRTKLAFSALLPRRLREKRERYLINQWRDSIIAQEQELLSVANEDKMKAVQAILMFNAVYVLEDENGMAYTEERMAEMSHQEVLDVLENYLEEMKKDVGGIE